MAVPYGSPQAILEVMSEQTLGVEEARAHLGDLIDRVARGGEPIVLSRRGHRRAVLVSEADFAALKELRRREAQVELRESLAEIRQLVSHAGLDTAVVDEAVAAARRAG